MLIQVPRVFVGREFDVIEVKEVGASQLKPIVKTNRLPDGTHRGRVLDDGCCEKLWGSNLQFGLTLSRDEWTFVVLSCGKLVVHNRHHTGSCVREC